MEQQLETNYLRFGAEGLGFSRKRGNTLSRGKMGIMFPDGKP